MHHATAPNEGQIEIVVCRYAAQLGAPINPATPRYANDASSGAWSIAECKWSGGCVVVTWVRLTLAPLQPQPMVDAIPSLPPPQLGTPPSTFVDNAGPAPVAPASAGHEAPQHGARLQSGRLQPSGVSAGPPVAGIPEAPALAPPLPAIAPQLPALAPPAIAALPHYYHLPSYARPREPLPDQRNVTVRGGVMPIQPAAAPAYQPPQPSAQFTPSPGVTVASSGLLASAEVRPFGGPLPPSPLDLLPPQPPRESGIDTMIGAVPPVWTGVTPSRPIAPAPRNVPQQANAAVSQRSATDPSGYTETVQTAPPLLTAPPVHPAMSPPDRQLFPRTPVEVKISPLPPPEVSELAPSASAE